MLSIRSFFLLALFSIAAILFSVFSYYFYTDQQKIAQLIGENMRHELSETAYVISSEIDNPNSIRKFKSFLHRKVANNPLIETMAITYGRKVVLTTDTSVSKPLPGNTLLSRFESLTPWELNQHKGFETRIPFFIQDRPSYFTLIAITDQDYIQNAFAQKRWESLIFFGVIPLVAGIFLWLFLKRFVSLPLELLRQYAYYQSKVPLRFKIREFEYIRSSMVQTFKRLDEERDQLYRLARTDDLSGLANRNQLNERLDWLISEFSRSGKEFALLFIDLDNFKTVNDSLGHDVGDQLLRNVSSLLEDVLRKYDIIARVGGDEFVIVLTDYRSNYELTQIIQRVLDRISEVHVVDAHPVKVSASTGVVFYPKDGQNITTLMKNADIAMYDAKNSGKNQFKFFTESLHQQIISEIELEQRLQRALDNNELQLYYQPKINVTTGQVVGAEALVRWIDPEKGILSPGEFIPAAEKNGLMVPMGDWILKEAMQQQVKWRQAGLGNIQISVNLSAVQLLDNHFDRKFYEQIQNSGIDPQKLDVEMTETVFMADSQQNLRSLEKILSLGVSISLDDFGTGYSSLAYLKTFPINTLKIDKSFMDDYQSLSGAIFIDTIVKIAHTIGLTVVAEGVEEKEQLDYLYQVGCEVYQGYYCSPPLPAKEFEAFLKATPDHCKPSLL